MGKQQRWILLGHGESRPHVVLETADFQVADESAHDGQPVLRREETLLDPDWREAVLAWDRGDDSAVREDWLYLVAYSLSDEFWVRIWSNWTRDTLGERFEESINPATFKTHREETMALGHMLAPLVLHADGRSVPDQKLVSAVRTAARKIVDLSTRLGASLGIPAPDDGPWGNSARSLANAGDDEARAAVERMAALARERIDEWERDEGRHLAGR